MEDHPKLRVILIDSEQAQCEILATRLRSQGYDVEPVVDSATGADMALRAPPAAIVADLWMPSISGVQICRLLRSEPATADVPIILRGQTDDPKSRFWAERAGAAAYVAKGRMGELVRALAKATSSRPHADGFFMQLSEGTHDIRDRIAQHLDVALFESVIASEVRALASQGSFDRLFDLLCQLLSQLVGYRWLAVTTRTPEHLGIHHHPKLGEAALVEVCQAFGVSTGASPSLVQDEDALHLPAVASALVRPILFSGSEIGRIALSVPGAPDADTVNLVELVARELGGPVRMAGLVEESRLQASTDPLTGLMNRRAFLHAMQAEMARCTRYDYPLSVALLDVDHFKQINDRHGHAAGDDVLVKVGAMLRDALRKTDLGVRWGGEEFVVALSSTDLTGGRIVAERLRCEIERLEILDAKGQRIVVTASIGLATIRSGETFQALVDRADAAMYVAKTTGRNRLIVDGEPTATAAARDEAPLAKTLVHA